MNNNDGFKDVYKNFEIIWWKTSSEFKLDMEKTNYIRKRKMENKFEKILDNAINHIDCFPMNPLEREEWKSKAFSYINDLISSEKTFKLSVANINLKDEFFNSTKKFIRCAREFDSSLGIDEIGQAMRNVWIINILQGLFNEKVGFTKSIYGYSMLYPYTDNYLDDTSIDIKLKKNFNLRLEKRLRGELIDSINTYECKVFSLVENIEEVFCRDRYPKVYDSLIEILNGQVKSLTQQDEVTIPYERDILGISIEKGGASVLVDGYLVRGDMTNEEINFCIGYGVLLQLADDLQDVKEDIKSKHITIMSQLAGKYPLDTIANKLINFTINLVDSYKKEDEKLKELKELIKSNCLNLILFSIIFSSEYFSKSYIKSIEPYVPFRIKYIEGLKENMRKKFSRVNNKSKDELMEILDEMVK